MKNIGYKLIFIYCILLNDIKNHLFILLNYYILYFIIYIKYLKSK